MDMLGFGVVWLLWYNLVLRYTGSLSLAAVGTILLLECALVNIGRTFTVCIERFVQSFVVWFLQCCCLNIFGEVWDLFGTRVSMCYLYYGWTMVVYAGT